MLTIRLGFTLTLGEGHPAIPGHFGESGWTSPPLATVAPMPNETFGDWGRQIAEAKCSVCGAQATGLREDGSLDFDGQPIEERSFRCDDHMENTGPGPLS